MEPESRRRVREAHGFGRRADTGDGAARSRPAFGDHASRSPRGPRQRGPHHGPLPCHGQHPARDRGGAGHDRARQLRGAARTLSLRRGFDPADAGRRDHRGTDRLLGASDRPAFPGGGSGPQSRRRGGRGTPGGTIGQHGALPAAGDEDHRRDRLRRHEHALRQPGGRVGQLRRGGSQPERGPSVGDRSGSFVPPPLPGGPDPAGSPGRLHLAGRKPSRGPGSAARRPLRVYKSGCLVHERNGGDPA